MRYLAFMCLTVCLLVFLACSYTNSFVVVNASKEAIQVSYTVKKPTAPNAPSKLPDRAPDTRLVSQLNEQIPWQQLPASRYKIDPDKRIVTLTLNSGEALLLEQCRPANGGTKGDCKDEAFFIDAITLAGANGEINLIGKQAHKSFVAESSYLYTLTYR